MVTKREFLFLVLEFVGESETESAVKMREYANSALAKMATENEVRKAKTSATIGARREAVLAVMTSELAGRETIAELAGVTPGQAVNALSFFVKEGKVVKESVKTDSKAHMMYRLA